MRGVKPSLEVHYQGIEAAPVPPGDSTSVHFDQASPLPRHASIRTGR